jgi:hypothetical protein
MDYVAAAGRNPIARAVKLADLKHNSDLSRMVGVELTEWDKKRNEKYLAAIAYLEGLDG